MQCDELLSALNDYMDGDTRSAICQAIREHMAECKACRIVIDNIRQTITLYRAGEIMPLPAGLHEKIHSIMRQRWAAKFPLAGRAG
jgi:predicted anti-sigma-YlaC factor YlaD